MRTVDSEGDTLNKNVTEFLYAEYNYQFRETTGKALLNSMPD